MSVIDATILVLIVGSLLPIPIALYALNRAAQADRKAELALLREMRAERLEASREPLQKPKCPPMQKISKGAGWLPEWNRRGSNGDGPDA